jgi:hypothetical protein
VFAVMLLHASFGIATMTMTSMIGGQFYHNVAPPWLSSIDSDQHLGVANPVEPAQPRRRRTRIRIKSRATVTMRSARRSDRARY